ncbi:hypothetical protein AOQ84DRAFT_283862 [Glonium stellatum]|uniref:Uncharacterized protein n=1 Tax=Glonium stellatum TaxID=574774 RepID=A0A8E2F9E8_9PEZI|nr:hypothetical protein AOQ84DRAFT_283862 [Glonium stellatum]
MKPCAYCIRTNQVCDRASGSAQQPRAVVFAPPQLGAAAPKSNSGFIRNGLTTPTSLCRLEIWTNHTDQLVSQFFSAFLTVNDLTGRSWKGLDSHIYDLLHVSSALRDIVIALAALNNSRMPHSTQASEGHIALKQRALISYSRSIRDVKGMLMSPVQLEESWESAIWVTFFLGIFELMFETSESNWEKHFLYGTSHLLRLKGPTACREGTRKKLFLTLRIFEISRALIYTDSSFLYEPDWMSLTQMLSEEAGNAWDPKEAMYDLMVCCSNLCIKALRYIQTQDPRDPFVGLSIATEGARMRQCLSEWHQRAQLHLFHRQPLKNVELLLSMIYYSALSIYISGIYDYRLSSFPLPATSLPILSRYHIQEHLSSIIKLTNLALEDTNLMGLLFLFPLRVAAARVQTAQDRAQVMGLLRRVRKKGFAILEVFEVEVCGLWEAQ